MTTRKQFELVILCPGCGATGEARASENDGSDTPDAAFKVDEFPSGFAEEKRSASRRETIVACRCGQVFYLL